MVDAAMTDGTAIQLAGIHGLLARGLWTDRRGSNLLDGGAPFYRVYRCADDRHVAVGALEPQFYAQLLARPRAHKRSAVRPPARPVLVAGDGRTPGRALRDTPARGLDRGLHRAGGMRRARADPGRSRRPPTQRRASRRTSSTTMARSSLAPAPRFLGTPTGRPDPVREIGADTDDVLAEAGLGQADIDALRTQGIVA